MDSFIESNIDVIRTVQQSVRCLETFERIGGRIGWHRRTSAYSLRKMHVKNKHVTISTTKAAQMKSFLFAKTDERCQNPKYQNSKRNEKHENMLPKMDFWCVRVGGHKRKNRTAAAASADADAMKLIFLYGKQQKILSRFYHVIHVASTCFAFNIRFFMSRAFRKICSFILPKMLNRIQNTFDS